MKKIILSIMILLALHGARGQNLALNPPWCGVSSSNGSQTCNKAFDNTVTEASKWVSNGLSAASWLELDLGAIKNIGLFRIRHAGSTGEANGSNLNTGSYSIYIRNSFGDSWTKVLDFNNTASQSVTEHGVSVQGRYLQLYISKATTSNIDNYARIAEFEVYAPAAPPPPTGAGYTLFPGQFELGLNTNDPVDGAGTGIAGPSTSYTTSSKIPFVRLNFLNRRGPGWLAEYDKIVDGYARNGVAIYALAGTQILKDVKVPTYGSTTDQDNYINLYKAQFREIVDRYAGKISVFEMVNEPDNWVAQNTPEFSAGFFARLMHGTYPLAARAGVKIISGPVFSHHIGQTANASGCHTNPASSATGYLKEAIDYGRNNLGWGVNGYYPFDGVGLHIYVQENGPEACIGQAVEAKLAGFHQMLSGYFSKKIYLSEIGFNSVTIGEYDQAVYIARALQKLRDVSGSYNLAMATLFSYHSWEENGGAKKLYWGLTRKDDNSPKPSYCVFTQMASTSTRAHANTALAQLKDGACGASCIQGDCLVTQAMVNAYTTIVASGTATIQSGVTIPGNYNGIRAAKLVFQAGSSPSIIKPRLGYYEEGICATAAATSSAAGGREEAVPAPFIPAIPANPDQLLTLLPNPFQNNLRIGVKGNSFIQSVQVMAVDGTVLFRQSGLQTRTFAWNGRTHINGVGELKAGVYLVQVILNDGRALAGKVVKL